MIIDIILNTGKKKNKDLRKQIKDQKIINNITRE